MQKIGLYGGTFDPPHLGHNDMIMQAKKQLGLDRLVVLPCGEPVHKVGVLESSHRMNMARLAFGGIEGVEVDDFEVISTKKNYTLSTLKHFKKKFKNDQLFFIIGGDSLEEFEKWYRPKSIVKLCTLAVVPRAHHNYKKAKDRVEKKFGIKIAMLKEEPINISSSEVRFMYDFAFPTSGLVSKEVDEYIKTHKLYIKHKSLCTKVKKFLSKDRYLHTFYTMLEGQRIAKSQAIDSEKAFLACLLHDIGKDMPKDHWEKFSFENTEQLPEPVIHAFLGEHVARDKMFKISDQDILNAIKYHTTGRANMSPLEKLVFVADAIEISRGSSVAMARKKVSTNFEEGFLLCVKANYNEAVKRNGIENVCELSKQCLKFYRKQARERNGKVK